jgi:hypothetical protein
MNTVWKDGIILAILALFFVIGILGIMGLRREGASPPALNVSLDDVTYTDKDQITVMGSTTKNAKLTVNGQTVKVDNNGNFSDNIQLNPGDNNITFESSLNNQKTDVSKKIVRQEGGQSVKSAQTGPGEQAATNELNNSGPEDNIFGVFGLVSVIFVIIYYRRSLRVRI